MVLFLFRTGPKLPDGNIRNYFLGKTPHSFLFTFCDEGLLFKDDVKIQDSFEFQGLYFNNSTFPADISKQSLNKQGL